MFVSVLFCIGFGLAFYFREPSSIDSDPGHSSALGVAGLLGIAFVMVVVHIAIGNGNKD